MKTLSERFVQQKRKQWGQLRNILIKIRAGLPRSLTDSEVENFARLYRLTCADLARARSLKLSPDVIEYLNNLVGQAHKFLYSFKPLRRSGLKEFFTITLPGTLIKHRLFLLFSALFFLLPYFITYLACNNDPEYASLLLSDDLLNMMKESYKKGFTEGRALGMSTMALTFYIQHNISIAFFSFAGGVLAGLGTIYFLIYNGIMLGAVSGYIEALGYGDNFLNFVTAHSVLELSGLIIAGAAGLLLGYTIINAGRFYKKDELGLQKKNIFTLLAVAVPMFILAAVIEGTVSPQPLPFGLKVFIALGSAALLPAYFLFLPLRRKAQKKSPEPL